MSTEALLMPSIKARAASLVVTRPMRRRNISIQPDPHHGSGTTPAMLLATSSIAFLGPATLIVLATVRVKALKLFGFL
jgi:hypothetical protein